MMPWSSTPWRHRLPAPSYVAEEQNRRHNWLQMWGMIGITCVVRHNLMVIAVNPDIAKREEASFHVATTIVACAWTQLAY